jgi:hypothetical protein
VFRAYCLLVLCSALCVLFGASFGANAATPEAQQLFNGTDLTGWDGDPRLWRVEGGSIIGETSQEKPAYDNTFLIWRGSTVPDDFAITLKVRITPQNDQGTVNTGIQFRSVVSNLATWRVRGLQADIASTPGYFGIVYDEQGVGRGSGIGDKTLITDPEPGQPYAIDKQTGKSIGPQAMNRRIGTVGERDKILAAIKHVNAWNDYRLVVRGSTIQIFVNGVQTTECDLQATLSPLGKILALQLHAGPPMKIEFKDIELMPPE